MKEGFAFRQSNNIYKFNHLSPLIILCTRDTNDPLQM